MITLHLRAPCDADFITIASWITDAKACARWAGPDMPFPFAAADLPALCLVLGAHSFCLIDEVGTLLGFAQCVEKGEGVMRLARVIVAPQQRGRGLSKALCEGSMRSTAQQGAVLAFSLGVYRDNPAAIRCYQQLGFVVVEEKCSLERLEMRRDGELG